MKMSAYAKYKSHFHKDKTLPSSPKLSKFEKICYLYGYVLGLWCLTIVQQYRGCQCYWWRKPECPEKTTDYYTIILHRVHVAWARFELTTSVVIGTGCTCSYKSNYHMITTTTPPLPTPNVCIQIGSVWNVIHTFILALISENLKYMSHWFNIDT